jgi:hypothetical protein
MRQRVSMVVYILHCSLLLLLLHAAAAAGVYATDDDDDGGGGGGRAIAVRPLDIISSTAFFVEDNHSSTDRLVAGCQTRLFLSFHSVVHRVAAFVRLP